MASVADRGRAPSTGRVRGTARCSVRMLGAALLALACGQEPGAHGPTDAATGGAASGAVERAPGTAEADVERPGRIILVSMDTVRADRVGDDDLTPRLDEIAAEGVRFDRFYAAASYTLPATMSILTGRDPLVHGVWTEAASLAPGVPTLAQVLAGAGYTALGLHEGGYVAPPFGFDRGFQTYSQFDPRQVIESGMPALLAWIRAVGSRPYFLFLHTYAAHAPYGGFDRYRERVPERGLPDPAARDALRTRYPRHGPDALSEAAGAPEDIRRLCSLYNQLRDDVGDFLGCGYNTLGKDFARSPHFAADRAALLASYDARIREIDAAIGRLRDLLVELGLWDDTLLIVTSDHGEAFFEHGLYQHGHVPFDEVLKVPLVISWPARLRDGPVRRVEALAWHLDLMPTVLGLANAIPPTGLGGVDLTPLLSGEPLPSAGRSLYPAVFRMPRGGAGSVRRVALRGDEKYIEGDAEFGDAEGLLFDLATTPDESENLREARPERFRALAEDARRYDASLTPIPARNRSSGAPITARPGEFVEPAQIVPEEEAALRALGYRE